MSDETGFLAAMDIDGVLQKVEPAPSIVVRVMQHSRIPCPSGKYHSCTDPHHPVAVQVLNVQHGGPPIAVTLVAGADFVSVSIP